MSLIAVFSLFVTGVGAVASAPVEGFRDKVLSTGAPAYTESSLGYSCNMTTFKDQLFAGWDDCEKHELVFLHIPKTGGESVETALGLRKNHATLRNRRTQMSQRDWDCAFKFSTVRNPWARWESWYSFCKSGYGPDKNLPHPHWACTIARKTTLSGYTKAVITVLQGIRSLELQGISPFKEHSIAKDAMSNEDPFYRAYYMGAQSTYLTDGVDLDTILPNFIIKFENLVEDFACLVSILRIDARLPHQNPSAVVAGKSTAERVAAFDEETRLLIEQFNSFEVEKYGYTFPG